MEQQNVQVKQETGRFRVYIRLIGFILVLISLAGFYRFGWYLLHWKYVHALIPPVDFWLVVNSSLFTGLFSVLVGVMVWRGDRKSRIIYLVWLVVLSALFWLEKIVVSNNPVSRTNWVFALVINLILAGCSLGILYSPRANGYYKEKVND